MYGWTALEYKDRLAEPGNRYLRITFLEGVTMYLKPSQGYANYHFRLGYKDPDGMDAQTRAHQFLAERAHTLGARYVETDSTKVVVQVPLPAPGDARSLAAREE